VKCFGIWTGLSRWQRSTRFKSHTISMDGIWMHRI